MDKEELFVKRIRELANLAYKRDITHKQETNDEYIQKLLNVSKEEIVAVASQVRLDTIFFLTGKDFNGKD